MGREKRKSVRKQLDRAGWIHPPNGEAFWECHISDVSQHGARLGVEDTQRLPDQFVLALSPDKRVVRHCMVVWRTVDEAGVEFVTPEEPKRGHSSTRTKAAAPAEA